VTCEQAEELLGAYAVDALTADEAASFAAHIAGCSEHAAKAAELRATASLLAETAPPQAPPPALRGRLLEAVASEPQDAAAATITPMAAGPRRREVNKASSGRGGWFTPNAWTAIAAGVAALAIGVGAWALSVSNDSDAQQFASAATAVRDLNDASGERVGTVVYFGEDEQAAVFIDDLPDAGEGMSYQMWAIEGGQPVSVAVMDEGTSGEVISVVDVDEASAEVLAITVEPAGGSDQPTSEPVFTAET
jgi:anti-sigma-K factor RskA